MDNTRNLSGTEVSKEAIASVESMTLKLANSLVKDYINSLKQTGNTFNVNSIDLLTTHVVSTAVISMKIGLKVNAKIINDLGIQMQEVNQSGFNEFEE